MESILQNKKVINLLKVSDLLVIKPQSVNTLKNNINLLIFSIIGEKEMLSKINKDLLNGLLRLILLNLDWRLSKIP